jgi:hypothetical protein
MKNFFAKILNLFDLIICRCTDEVQEVQKQTNIFMKQLTKGHKDVFIYLSQ